MVLSNNKSSFNEEFIENYRECRNATILMFENMYLNYSIKPLFLSTALYSISFIFFLISYFLKLQKIYIYSSLTVALISALLMLGISTGLFICAKILKKLKYR